MMAAISPSPNSTPSAVITPSSSPPTQSSSPPTSAATSLPPSQLGASSPNATSPLTNVTSPPPEQPLPSPQPPMASPPPQSPNPPSPVLVPPPSSSPPPPTTPSPSSPPPPSSIPPTNSPPPPSANPHVRSPPPPSTNPPTSSPPPPSTNPPASSPPPPSIEPPTSSVPPRPALPRSASPPPSTSPLESSPPPPSTQPPKTSPTPPSSKPTESSPPPPVAIPPQNSPPPPASDPSRSSPPPPVPKPPSNSSPPPIATPSPHSPPASSPSSHSPAGILAPPPVIRLSPPPPSGALPVSPPPPLVPSGDPTTNTNGTNASDSTGSTGGGGIGTGGIVTIGLVVGLLLLGFIGTAAWCIWKQKKRPSGLSGGYILPTSYWSSPKSDSSLLKLETSATNNRTGSGNDFIYSPTDLGGLGNSKPWFTYEELVEATNGFSVQNLLGEGGFGSVHKGSLVDGREVAVKQLKVGGDQGEREFRAEVEIISRIHHRHLVSLVGYCISENARILVYDYVPNNTLYFHLHGDGRPVMDWVTRIKIAVGAARGIAYLHEDCHPRIIHRDIKSSNILLDNNFEARVSDFGLAKLFQDSNTHVTTRVVGTFGYMAPEYASSGKLTEKSDVFSFGVVLLELITGRKPVDVSQPLGDESLVEWARPLLSQALETEKFEGLVDPRLQKNYVDNEVFRLIEVAAACVRHSSAKRPQMGQVVRAFDTVANSDLTNGMRVGESEIFNSAEQSEEIRLFRRMAFGIQDFNTDFFSQSSQVS